MIKRISAFSAALAAAALLAGCSSNGKASLANSQSSQGNVTDFGIAYIKRTLPTDATALAALRNLDDLRRLRPVLGTADVYVRDAAAPSGKERNITTRLTGTGQWDVRDLDVSADGTRLVFAMRGPLVANMQDYDLPTWRLYEYVLATDDLHPLTDDVTANGGQDVSPHYLPADSTHPYGRVLLASTRQRQSKAVLLAEGKPAFEAQVEPTTNGESAFTLEVLDPTLTGPSAYQQLTFNQSHDRDPSVLASGRILYTRWDHATGSTNDAMHLYTANPDGSDVQLLFGAHSHATGTPVPASGVAPTVQYARAREMQDGRILALARPMGPGSDFGGNLVIINAGQYVECTQRTLAAGAGNATVQCPALAAATGNDVRTVAGPSPGGRFHDAFPLWDGTGRILVSWSLCRLQDATGTILACTDANLANAALVPAVPLYSLFLFNPADNTFKPVMQPVEGEMVSDVVSLQAHAPPAFIAPTSTASTLAGDGMAILDIRSVYDFGDATFPGVPAGTAPATFIGTMATTPAAQRAARFLRFEKPVSMGDKDLGDGFPDFDRAVALDHSVGYMREVLGYVPLEADGSVRVKVPANVAFALSVVDKDGRRLGSFPQHRAWLQLRPGEVKACNGCHSGTTATSTTSHGRAGLFASANAGDASSHTLAQQRFGTAGDCSLTPCNAAAISLDMAYDPASDPAAGGATAITTSYSLLSTLAPTPLSCLNSYQSACRLTINYGPSGTTAPMAAPGSIHPLWSTTINRPGGVACIGCHLNATVVVPCTRTVLDNQGNVVLDAFGNPVMETVQATIHTGPAAGLDLTTDPAQQANSQYRAYVQLMTAGTYPTGQLDARCNETLGTRLISIQPGSAANSRLLRVLLGQVATNPAHAGMMTSSELRLLAEWVDIGAQYYNNPFNAPLN